MAADASPDETAKHGAIEGRVISASTGAPIVRAELTFARHEETASVSSGLGGAFRFVPRIAGSWALAAASAPGFLPFAPEWGQSPVSIVLRPNEVVRGVVISLVPAEDYAGRVLDEAGAPVAGAVITISGGGTGTNTLLPTRPPLVSKDDGGFTFQAPEDAVLEARHPGYLPGRARVDYAARVSRRVEVRLRRSSALALSIDGVVEDVSGAPAPSALVSARPRSMPGAAPAVARADATGHFEITDVEPGTWVVSASLGARASASVEAPAGAKDVTLRLTSGGRIMGCATERGSGRPVSTFTIFVRGAHTIRQSVMDRRGCYDISGAALGPNEVDLVAPGYAPAKAAHVDVTASGAAIADFELSPGGIVTGIVVDRATRAPLPLARVAVEGTEDASGVPVRNETVTDAGGHFRLTGLSEETLGLFAAAEGHHGRLISLPHVADGQEFGPVTVDLRAVAPGEDPKLELVGIGAVLEKKGDSLVVVDVIAGGGAASVGIVPGDSITAIDTAPVATLSFTEAVQRLRGPEGTTVMVAVVKVSSGTAQQLMIPRQAILN